MVGPVFIYQTQLRAGFEGDQIIFVYQVEVSGRSVRVSATSTEFPWRSISSLVMVTIWFWACPQDQLDWQLVE